MSATKFTWRLWTSPPDPEYRLHKGGRWLARVFAQRNGKEWRWQTLGLAQRSGGPFTTKLGAQQEVRAVLRETEPTP